MNVFHTLFQCFLNNFEHVMVGWVNFRKCSRMFGASICQRYTNIFTFLLAHRERVKYSRIFFGTDGETLVNIEIYTKLWMISRQTQWYTFHSRICCDTCDRFNRISNSTKTRVFLNHICDAHMILAFLNFPVDINDAALYTIENLNHQYLKQAEVL